VNALEQLAVGRGSHVIAQRLLREREQTRDPIEERVPAAILHAP
jgi:hypothetical protein